MTADKTLVTISEICQGITKVLMYETAQTLHNASKEVIFANAEGESAGMIF